MIVYHTLVALMSGLLLLGMITTIYEDGMSTADAVIGGGCVFMLSMALFSIFK